MWKYINIARLCGAAVLNAAAPQSLAKEQEVDALTRYQQYIGSRNETVTIRTVTIRTVTIRTVTIRKCGFFLDADMEYFGTRCYGNAG